MLKVSFLEFIVKGIPDGFLFILASHAFSKSAIQKKQYLVSSLLFAIIVYLVRSLPIQSGSYTILNLIMLITLTIIINKIEIIQSVRAGIISMIIGFLCEGIDVIIIRYVLGKDLNKIFNDDVLKVLYASPASFIFGCIIIIYYLRLSKRKELKVLSYGKIS